jgi:uncharacterized protein YraI
MRRLFLLILLVAMLLVAALARAQTATPECASFATLTPDTWARIASDTPNNLRAAPSVSAERIGMIPAGDIFLVLEGPACADGYVWWQVAYVDVTGWTAAGRIGETAWVEPLAGQEVSALPTVDDPAGCLRPPDDYTRIIVNGFAEFNLRTLAMLDYAQVLYSAGGGVIRLRTAVMQGGYNNGYVAASFGTHDGGGAVDLSVRDLETRMVLQREIEPLLEALRTAGFAAWLRRENQLNPGSVIHIHAIAIGDAEASAAARAQVDGEYGYLRGYNGLPLEWGGPALDDMPLVFCSWMAAMGLRDLRS